MTRRTIICLGLLGILWALQACKPRNKSVPTVGFADAFVDNTIEQAKQGFIDALRDSGYSEPQKTINIIYRNAQGSALTLTQIIKYLISEKVDLIATNPSLATITAIQNTKEIPIFMMVSPTPEMMKVTDPSGNPPSNLFGVSEQQDYIDTSFALIGSVIKPASGTLSVGMIYNQSETQSVAAVERLKGLAEKLGVRLLYLPVNSSADVQLVTASLLDKHIDVFFANPDNTVFSAFETIVKACNQANVPVFTSEAGLVSRGAVAAYGADIYQWGYQAGQQAAHYLKTKGNADLHWQLVSLRKRVYNPAAARRFGLTIPASFQPLR